MQMNENFTAETLSRNYPLYPTVKFYFLSLLTSRCDLNRITTWTITLTALMCIAQRIAAAHHGVNAQSLHILSIPLHKDV